MARSTYYEVIGLVGRGYEDETFATENNFTRAVEEGLLYREAGDVDAFSIVQTIRDGDEAEHFEVAYVAADDRENDRYTVLRIVDPNRLSDYPEWLPSGPGKEFVTDGKRRKVVPMADPATMPGRTELLSALERLPHYADSSYKNDVSPSRVFSLGDTAYKLFIAPGRIPARSDDQDVQYALFVIDRASGDDLSEAIENDELIWEPVVYSDDPMEVMRFIGEHANDGDPALERTRLLDLGTKRKSYDPKTHGSVYDDISERARLIGHELAGDDPTLNPGRRRRARRNPDDVAAAKEKFEEFHRHKPRKIFEGKSPIPAKVRELGKAKAVLYRSDKNDPDTGRAVKHPINYIHDHDAGVHCYTPASGGTIPVPAFIRDAEALVLLGKCLGFDFEDASGLREAKGIKPYPDLYATPCGKALLVIQDRRQVLAIVWGGGLGVEARGIVG